MPFSFWPYDDNVMTMSLWWYMQYFLVITSLNFGRSNNEKTFSSNLNFAWQIVSDTSPWQAFPLHCCESVHYGIGDPRGLSHYSKSVKNHLKLSYITKLCSSATLIQLVESFWNFAQSVAVILPCSVQNFKMIRQLTNQPWTKVTFWNLSLCWYFP